MNNNCDYFVNSFSLKNLWMARARMFQDAISVLIIWFLITVINIPPHHRE